MLVAQTNGDLRNVFKPPNLSISDRKYYISNLISCVVS